MYRFETRILGNGGNYQFIAGTTTIDTGIASDLNKHTYVLDAKNLVCKVDNQSFDLPDETIDLGPVTLGLLARKYDGTNNLDNFTVGKLYGTKIKQLGQDRRDFVPCYRKTDNTIGLWDTVYGQFYTNNGTGTFLKGPDVV